MNKLLLTIKREFFELVPVTVFFFFAFTLIMMTKKLALMQYGISISGFTKVAIGALLVGKAVLIADQFKFINRYPDKPLLYNVVWKTSVYFLATWVVRYLEELLPFLAKHHSFMEANRHLLAELVWPHFWLIQMWLAVLFLAYCAMRELTRAIGREKVIRMFIGGAEN